MIVGIDVGTQSLKVVVTDDALAPRGTASTGYVPTMPAAGRAEQHPALWEAALAPTIGAALADAGARADEVVCLGITGQLDGCVPVDGDGNALGPCLIWMDRRAEAELAGLPLREIRATTGTVPDASHLGAKIRWLRRHGGTARPARYHQPVSYLVERLTGEAVIDHALASTSMLYGLAARDYDPALLDLFEIARGELPGLREATDPAGSLNARGAALTGLERGIPVAVGTGDDFASPLGAGVFGPGAAAVVLGTGEVVGTVHGAPLIDSADLVETHAYPAGGYFLENPGWLAGGAISWLIETLALRDAQDLDCLAAQVPPAADGLIFLPALSGAMAPEWHAGARGCFYGLTPAHGKGHLARAVLEGCAFAMRDVVDRLCELGARVDRLALTGGGARSRIWAQIRADVVGLPAVMPTHRHSAPMGAAMLAAVAGEIAPSLAAIPLPSPAPAAIVEPDPCGAEALGRAYGRYRRLFESLRPMFSAAPASAPSAPAGRHDR
jgi:xylulokinase